MKPTKLKAVLAAALIAGAGASAYADDAAEETVVASAAASLWLGPDEFVEASAEATFWLGPTGEPVGENAWIEQTDCGCYIVGEGTATNLPSGFNRNSITNVTVEDGISEIGEAFFYKCRKLKTVTLGKDVVTVGTNAFYLCVKLEKIAAGNAAAVESLAGAVVIRAAFDSEGYPCVVPQIEAPGWKTMMLATDNLAEPKWDQIDPKEAFADGAPARFFKFVIQPITIK